MKNENRFKYLSSSVGARLTTLIIVILINYSVILWIENKISLEKPVVLNLFILSLVLEICGFPIIISSLIFLVRLQGINRYYKVAIMIPISIEFIINIYYMLRFFGFSCFAPGITLIGVPFALYSLIFVIFLRRKILNLQYD